MPDVDALILGGGPAGLSAALVLARALRRVAVLDGDADGVKARSTWPQVNHNLLGWPDGLPAARLRELGRAQLCDYDSMEVIDEPAASVVGTDGGFVATTAQGRERRGRIVLLATGVEDSYPRFPGWEDYVGRSLHWCLACDAYAARSKRLVAIGADEAAALDALQLRRFTEDVVLVTGTTEACAVDDEHRRRLETAGVDVVEGAVVGAEGSDGRLEALLTSDGTRVPCDEAFSLLPPVPRNGLASALGASTDPAGFVGVDAEQRTDVPGVFAAGDLTRRHSHQLATALHEGTQAGHAMSFALLPDELRG